MLDKFYRLLIERKPKRIGFSFESLDMYNSISGNSQHALLCILRTIKYRCDLDAIKIDFGYDQSIYGNRVNYSRCKEDLLSRRFIIEYNGNHYVNPFMINYFSRRQLEYFSGYFNVKKSTKANFGLK